MKIIKTTYTPPGLSNRPNKDEIITFVNPFFLSFICYHYRLLYSVLPKSVANELRHQRPVAPKRCVYLYTSLSNGYGSKKH